MASCLNRKSSRVLIRVVVSTGVCSDQVEQKCTFVSVRQDNGYIGFIHVPQRCYSCPFYIFSPVYIIPSSIRPTFPFCSSQKSKLNLLSLVRSLKQTTISKFIKIHRINVWFTCFVFVRVIRDRNVSRFKFCYVKWKIMSYSAKISSRYVNNC